MVCIRCEDESFKHMAKPVHLDWYCSTIWNDRSKGERRMNSKDVEQGFKTLIAMGYHVDEANRIYTEFENGYFIEHKDEYVELAEQGCMDMYDTVEGLVFAKFLEDLQGIDKIIRRTVTEMADNYRGAYNQPQRNMDDNRAFEMIDEYLAPPIPTECKTLYVKLYDELKGR